MADSSKQSPTTQILIQPRDSLKTPEMFKVIMLNDDFTTQEFVVDVLVTVFRKSLNEARGLMMDIHTKGRGIAGVFTYDIAMTKISLVHKMARENEFPLKCIIERA